MIKGMVAIIGRANVGKSTLFNRLVGEWKALVADRPGVTRDRIFGLVNRNDREGEQFTLVDTGGFEDKKTKYQPFEKNIVWEQTEAAIEESDLVVLLFDGKDGAQPHDEQLVRYLQKMGKEVIYAVNKVDHGQMKAVALEFHNFGIDNIYNISASHNRNVADLKETIEARLDEVVKRGTTLSAPPDATHIAIVGRPNVGKSSILNRLLGKPRSLVSDIAGTTRDTIDTVFNYNKQTYVILDTAGIRRKSKIHDSIESLSVMKSMRAIERADVVVLVIDASEGLTDQDARLADLANSQFKPVLLVVNKWDLIEDKDAKTARQYELDIKNKIKTFAYVPVLFISCLENQRVPKIMTHVEELMVNYKKRVGTAKLNEFLGRIVKEHTPALIRNHSKLVKFYYATQVRIAPPTIVIKCNVSDDIQESYKRYIKNRFRDELGFKDVPLQLIFRPKTEKNPDIENQN